MTSDSGPVQDRITAFWSATAPSYEDHPGNVAKLGTPEYEAWVAALRGALPAAAADVLDLGTGTGFAALIAAALGHRVTGIDLAEGMLAQARTAAERRGLSVSFLPGDAVAPPFPDRTFDVVMSRHLIWTLRDPETAFRNWLRLLRPGGRVIAIDALWFSPEEGPGDKEDDDLGIFGEYYTKETRAALPGMHLDRPEAVVAIFQRAGFEDVEVNDLVIDPGGPSTEPTERPLYLLVARHR